jgi:hypothetical protein
MNSETLKPGLVVEVLRPLSYVVDAKNKFVTIPKGARGVTEEYSAPRFGTNMIGFRMDGLEHPETGYFGLGRAGQPLPDGLAVVGRMGPA